MREGPDDSGERSGGVRSGGGSVHGSAIRYGPFGGMFWFMWNTLSGS